MIGIRFFRFLLKAIAIILIVSFVVLNREEANFYYSPINDPISLPLWLMGLVLFALGFTVGALLLWLNSWSIKRDLNRKTKQLEEAEKDRAELGENLHDHQMTALDHKEKDF